MPIRQLINVKTAAPMISLFRNERVDVDKTKEVQTELDPWWFWLIQNRRQCKKVNVFSLKQTNAAGMLKSCFSFCAGMTLFSFVFFSYYLHYCIQAVLRNYKCRVLRIPLLCRIFTKYFFRYSTYGICDNIIRFDKKIFTKHIFNQSECIINFKSQPNWLHWII